MSKNGDDFSIGHTNKSGVLGCRVYIGQAGMRVSELQRKEMYHATHAQLPYTTVCHTLSHYDIINTSYQRLPFGSGDYPDKLLFHQALN